jgi:23S rRNA (cytosine1962-C5)-methyltransferase
MVRSLRFFSLACRCCDHRGLKHIHQQPQVSVSRRAAERHRTGHPWIFRSDVTEASAAKPGDLVRVLDHQGRLLGQAHYSSTSQIALRMLSGWPAPIDLGERIAAAQSYRENIVSETNAYRVVHAEADLLPGLIIDRYADCFSIQTLNQGMDKATPEIVAALEAQFSPRAIVARNDSAVRTLEELPRETKVLSGELDGPVLVTMNGYAMQADLLHGHKTGVYLDQRENYLAAAKYAYGRALDCFTSTGGFAIHMAGVCKSVEAVDSSLPALTTADHIAKSNNIGNIDFVEGDVFELLSNYTSARKSFDTVVLDPPAFAKSRKQVDGAARGYKDINLRAFRLLEAGGILVTCSCSHHMSEAALMEIAADAAADAGRTVRVLEVRRQAQDHPVLLSVPETLYLKCLILQVV